LNPLRNSESPRKGGEIVFTGIRFLVQGQVFCF
jgi:hypothetical protein